MCFSKHLIVIEEKIILMLWAIQNLKKMWYKSIKKLREDQINLKKQINYDGDQV